MGKFLDSLKSLESWFERQKRVLPWRDEPTLYRVWVSEIMLQQTQVITVIPYFEKFIARFPTVNELAQAREEDVLFQWSGLGYYSRARNLHRGAQKICQKIYEGKVPKEAKLFKKGKFPKGIFPETREGWLEIPGVGDYTAGAILSIALNQPEAILDGNVERVLSRIRRASRQKGDSAYKSRLWKLSDIFVETSHDHHIPPSVLNQALMELGATVCTPKKPKCKLCPLIKICRSYSHEEQELYPPKKKPKNWIKVEEKMHGLLNNSGRILLRQRKGGEWRAGLWDLLEGDLLEQQPVAKANKSLQPYSSIGSRKVLQYLGEVETHHTVTRHKIRRTTQVWKIAEDKGVKASQALWQASEAMIETGEEDLRWISIESPEVAVGSALKKTLKQIIERFS